MMGSRRTWVVGATLLLVGWIVFWYEQRCVLPSPDSALLTQASYSLVDPEEAPPAIKAQVMRGFNILLETKKNLPEYAGDRISCTNCHFSCGNTLGGEQNGFSLVGVAQVYPKKLEDGTLFTLPDRINACFLKSTNGKALPVDSEPMKAMVAYLEWISQHVATLPDRPWLGVKQLRTSHRVDVANGEKVYTAKCALCHGIDGDGQSRKDDRSYPPLWGDHSFNSAAGMNELSTISSFVYYNMPYHEPRLSIEDAIDVSAYVISRPRPEFAPLQTP